MKESWLKIAAKVDALSMRERVMVFGAGVALLVFLTFLVLLDPMQARQKALQAQFRQQQNQIAGIDAEVAVMLMQHAQDPDGDGRVRLKALQAEVEALSGALRSVQTGLVAPEKIVLLLERLLKSNSKLRLVSLKTLPGSGLSDGRFSDPVPADAADPADAMQAGARPPPPPGAPAAGSAPAKPAPLLFRHGVEIELQGNYLDMVDYMEALETMPTQLFWGKAKLNAEKYPNARLTLTLYTLSLAPKWIAL